MKYYVSDFLRMGFIPAIDGGAIKSDRRIPSFLSNELQRTITSLPRHTYVLSTNDDMVVDVVDPHYFPFVWGRTRTLREGRLTLSDCLSRCGEGEEVRMPSSDSCVQKDPAKYPNDMAWSCRFQFLPFDVGFDNKGEGGSR